MYRSKSFSIRRDISAIKAEIEQARLQYGNRVRKIFFEDGNAFTAEAEMLIELSAYCRRIHPHLRRISAYAHVQDILRKADKELKRLAEAGFSLVYVGIESGDDEVLKTCRKGATHEDYVVAAHRCHRAGIAWSGIFLLGLTGNDAVKGQRHARESARLINRLAPPQSIPWYVSPLTLEPEPGSELWKMEQHGEFETGSFSQILEELHTLIAETDDGLRHCFFNSDHLSNYLRLKGELARDKAAFLQAIDKALKDPLSRQYDW